MADKDSITRMKQERGKLFAAVLNGLLRRMAFTPLSIMVHSFAFKPLQVRSQILVAADGKGLAFEQITGDKLQFAWRDLL